MQDDQIVLQMKGFGVFCVDAVASKGGSPCVTAGKTIEVRRLEAAGDRGKSDTVPQLQRLFYTSTEDRNRAQIGLPPMPKPVPPPPPPSKERTQEILNDDRVKVQAHLNAARIDHPQD